MLRELNQLVSQPATRITLQRLEDTFEAAKPLVKWVVPQQTVCNYWNYWFTFIPNALSERRRDRLHVPPGPDELPAAGRGDDADRRLLAACSRTAAPPRLLGGTFEPYTLPIINAHPYGPAGLKDADCQAGQSGYDLGQALVPGQAADNPAYGVSDLPGSRGPTTLFYNAERNRTFLDTRNPDRAPEGWQDIK